MAQRRRPSFTQRWRIFIICFDSEEPRLASGRWAISHVFEAALYVMYMYMYVFCLTRRSLFGPDGISLRGALEAGGP